MLTASLIPRGTDLETAMVAVGGATRQVVAVEYRPEETFWRRWWARIGEGVNAKGTKQGAQVHSRTALAAVGVAYARHLQARRSQRCQHEK